MTARNDAKPDLADLTKAFRELADELGSPWNLGVRRERYRRGPERAQRVARMNVLIPELRSQAPAETLTALMEDENIDTRTWAAMRFSDVDEDLSRAVTVGICEDVSTREAFDSIAHARKPPPKAPPLSKMSVEEIVRRFEDACGRMFWTRYTGGDGAWDVELRNKIGKELHDINMELDQRAALDRLLPYLDSADITQRASAARATLKIAPKRAIQAMEEVAASKELPDSAEASNALRFYKREGVFW